MPDRHHEDMFVYVLIAFLVLVGPLAVIAGADSHVDDVERRRGYSG